ncbi:MAG: hypothetical protein QXX12_00950 [Nanopusillaceae archaeon]
MRNKRLVKISAACAGLLLGLGALSSVESGELIKRGDESFSTFPGISRAYKVAFEVYNSPETILVSGAEIGIKLNSEIKFDILNVEISFPEQNAKFVISPNHRFVLIDKQNNIVAASSMASSLTTNSTIILSSSYVDIPSTSLPFTMPKDGKYYLRLISQQNSEKVPSTSSFGATMHPHIILERFASASCTDPLKWKLRAKLISSNQTVPYNIVDFKDVTFAYVTPRFTAQMPEENPLEKTLDDDFTKFSGNATTISLDNFVVVQDNAGTDWIVNGTDYNGILRFTISSENPQPGVTIRFNNRTCTNSGNTTWTCEGNVTVGNHALTISVNGTQELSVTTWTFSNATFNPQYCLSLPSKEIGSWTGGYEAIVPFVRYNPAIPADTYIVLYNRSDRKVKVFAANMLEDTRKVINPKTLIDEIQPKSSYRISASELGSKLNISENALKDGVPIKFLFYAPGASSTNDPFIEGIVISVYAGEHRSVPLKFRFDRHGRYSE